MGGGTGTSAPDNDKPGGGNDSPPVDALLVQIKVLGTATAINVPLEFTAEISGTEAKNATVSWSATSGSFLGSPDAPTVTWIAPAQAGTATISVEAKAGTETAKTSVEVMVDQPPEPLTVTLAGLPTESIVGEPNQLSADTAESSPDTVFTWFVDDVAVGTGSTLNWRTPVVPGKRYEVTVHATAGDRAGSATKVMETTMCSAGSAGDPANPCVLNTLHQLQAMHYVPDGHFKPGRNIDASPVTTNIDPWDGGGFMPIGTTDRPFAGSFDGNSLAVSNLYLQSDDPKEPLGMFGVIGATG